MPEVWSDLVLKGDVSLKQTPETATHSHILVLGPNNKVRKAERPKVMKVFDTLAELNAYLNDPNRYAGQLATCKEAEGDVFILNNTKDEWILAAQQGEPGPKGDKPDHNWSNTSLQFEKPDGSWGSYVDLQGPPGVPGQDGQDFSAFGTTYRDNGLLPSSMSRYLKILPDSVTKNPGFYTVNIVMQLTGFIGNHYFTAMRVMDFSLYVGPEESDYINVPSDLKVSHHSGIYVKLNTNTTPYEPQVTQPITDNNITLNIQTNPGEEGKTMLVGSHNLNQITGDHFDLRYKLQSQYHSMKIDLLTNLLINAYFQNWINQSTPEIWTADHNQQERSTESLEGEYSLRINHGFAYTGGRTDEQAFTDHNASGVPTQYTAEIWVKGWGDIRIGIQRPGYSVHDYGPWHSIMSQNWTKITFTTSKDNRLGSEGNFRIQHQRMSGLNDTDLRIDATGVEPSYQT